MEAALLDKEGLDSPFELARIGFGALVFSLFLFFFWEGGGGGEHSPTLVANDSLYEAGWYMSERILCGECSEESSCRSAPLFFFFFWLILGHSRRKNCSHEMRAKYLF